VETSSACALSPCECFKKEPLSLAVACMQSGRAYRVWAACDNYGYVLGPLAASVPALVTPQPPLVRAGRDFFLMPLMKLWNDYIVLVRVCVCVCQVTYVATPALPTEGGQAITIRGVQLGGLGAPVSLILVSPTTTLASSDCVVGACSSWVCSRSRCPRDDRTYVCPPTSPG
jgi:hypothetical protein